MNKHIGSSFDDFLEEEGLLAETESVAIKRVLAYQISQLMKSKKLSKVAMAKKMKTSRSTLDRLLDSKNTSITFYTLERAAQAMGKRLRIDFA